MKEGFITFRSVTYAQRAENALRRGGVECALQRTPKWMEEMGCGYCLRLSRREMASAVKMLRLQNIGFRKVYLRGEDGSVEEMPV